MDAVVKTNKYDTCGIKRKKFVLFPATDLTAGVLFRAELSKCEPRREAGAVGSRAQSQVLILSHTLWHTAVL